MPAMQVMSPQLSSLQAPSAGSQNFPAEQLALAHVSATHWPSRHVWPVGQRSTQIFTHWPLRQ
jgi:hypothetical protein